MRITKETKVYIPHIDYTVYLKDFSRLGKRDLRNHYVAITEEGNKQSAIYIHFPVTDIGIPTLCHEIVHVLQNIGNQYGVNIFQEKEHMAYIFQFILNGFLGYKYT